MRPGIVIVGAGGHGRVILDILLEAGKRVMGFVDDDPSLKGRRILGYPVLGGRAFIKPKMGLVLGIGNNRVRQEIYRCAKNIGARVIQAVHPNSAISRFADLGEGVVIMAGAIINSGVVMDVGSVVNTGATVDHDCRLGAFCQIWPGAHLAGSVEVGERSYVGTGAAVVPGVRIGADVLIGAGAAVVSDLSGGNVFAGVPARMVERKRTMS